MTEPRDIAAYPPEYFELFRRAAKEVFTIELGSEKEAIAARAKLYRFRSRLKLARPDLYLEAQSVELLVRDNALICQPTGSLIREAFRKAGLEAPQEAESEGTDLDQQLLDKIRGGTIDPTDKSHL